MLNILVDGKPRVYREVRAESLAELPVPIPNIGERIEITDPKTRYSRYWGIVREKEISMTDLVNAEEDPEIEVPEIFISIWADQVEEWSPSA